MRLCSFLIAVKGMRKHFFFAYLALFLDFKLIKSINFFLWSFYWMMSIVSERISDLLDHISVEELKIGCRMEKTDFTRKSRLNFVNLVMFIIANTGKSLTMELVCFFYNLGELEVTKEALSQRRLKLKSLVFKKLWNFYLEKVYENPSKIKLFHGCLLMAGDGSKTELPFHKKLIEIFGGSENKIGEITKCMGNSSTLYDVLNHYIFDFEIDTYKTSEKTLIYRNLKNLFRIKFLKQYKKIFILDRGYPSIEFFYYLIKKNEKFVFRLKKSAYKKEKARLRNDDQYIDIEITKNRMNHIKDLKLKAELLEKEKLNLRIIQYKLTTGEIEYLITNLDKKDFKHKDIVEIYHLRWGIEGSFKTLKSGLKFENISGYSKLVVEQDMYSQILVYNIIKDIENKSQKIKDFKNKNSKFKKKKQGKINTHIVIGHFKLFIISIYKEIERKARIKIISPLILKLTKFYTNTSTKKRERPENTPHRKNPTNNRKLF